MNHLDKTEARLAFTQFLMECESSKSGKWIINPVDAKVDKIFKIGGQPKYSWVMRKTDDFLNLYFAEYIYEWLSQIPVTYIGINWISKSIDIYFGISNDGEISTFGLRFPFDEDIADQSLEDLKTCTMLQIACVPKRLDQPGESIATGIAIQIRHILEGA